MILLAKELQTDAQLQHRKEGAMKACIKETRKVLFPFEQREMLGKVHYVDNVADKNRLGWEMVEEFEVEHADFEPVEYQLVIDNSFDKENGIEECI